MLPTPGVAAGVTVASDWLSSATTPANDGVEADVPPICTRVSANGGLRLARRVVGVGPRLGD